MGEQSERFTPYDSADYVTGIEDVAAYLKAAIDEAGDDPALIAQALGTIARSGNLSELARRVGMSREGLYRALSAEGNPSFATIFEVARAIRLRIHFESVA
jgi:probable addiction module antidote protein